MFGHHALQDVEHSVAVLMPIAVVPEWIQFPLAAWCFRACCTSACTADDAIKKAHILHQRFLDNGIDSLDRLKREMNELQTSKPSRMTDVSSSGEKEALGRQEVFRLFR